MSIEPAGSLTTPVVVPAPSYSHPQKFYESGGRIILQPHTTEETRLRAVVMKKYPRHLQELDIALHTGMRRSEQYGLTWANVNLVRGMITIPRSKNGEMRHLPLNAVALAAFRSLEPKVQTDGPVFVGAKIKRALKGGRHWFNKAVEEAGIRRTSDQNGRMRPFNWHLLRHTHASRLVMAGVNLRTVQELMGHKTIGMTERYAHLAPEHLKSAVDVLVPAPEKATPTHRRRQQPRYGTIDNTMATRSIIGVAPGVALGRGLRS